jgi:hypothetical protein
MPGPATRPNQARKTKAFLVSAGLLILILALLFRESFKSGMVAFSNDSPLGEYVAKQVLLPQGFFGQWIDLNTIGYNGGSASVNVSSLIKYLWEGLLNPPFGPLGFANSYTPIALFILGLGALVFFKQLKFTPLAAFLGSLAVIFSSTFFGGACWGIASLEIAIGFNFFAMALVSANDSNTPWMIRWVRFALAGMCVGINVMESPDVGGLASIFVAFFVFFKALAEEDGAILNKMGWGAIRVAVVAVFAGFLAYQSVISVVSVAITGVAGTEQDASAKAARWDYATQWSLPKTETLSLIVPGLFGFKMDTPNEMPPSLQDVYQGGLYWGGMGRDPVNDRFLDSGGQGPLPDPQWMRQTGNGNYCGVVVVLIGAWTIAQSFRRKNSVFSPAEKRMIWFWSAVLFVSLLLAWGRFAPFYALVYHLPIPYFSTFFKNIRNPTKFIIFLSWALAILFAYGVNALNRTQLVPTGKAASLGGWWKRSTSFDRNWTFVCAGLFVVSLAGWLIYSHEKPALIQYLEKVGFSDEDLATQIAAFSIGEAGWFVGLLAATIVLVVLLIGGFFNGLRTKIGIALLSALLLFDFVLADLPYIIHWNYAYKYEVGSLNPVETFLRDKSYEHRVAILPDPPFQAQTQLREFDGSFGGLGLYRIEWAQHHFPYYNIQSLDIIQMPRMPEDLKEYLDALSPHSMAELPRFRRLWELTNTRYLLGPAGFLNVLNTQLDPGRERFRFAQRFDIVAKEGVTKPTKLEDLTAATNPDGDLALFEFTGALPRAKLYSNWQVNTNDQAALKRLADESFDPAQTVLVATQPKDWPATATNANSGSVEYQSYGPDDIVLKANAASPSILLLNDKYDAHWTVTVDGKAAELLKCNFIMRGVCVPPGEHTVSFRFRVPMGLLYILSSFGFGLLLAAILAFHSWRNSKVQPEKV